jgi:hypothetical protein
MVIYDVVIGPKNLKRGNRQQERSSWAYQGVRTLQCSLGIFKMFQNIEHHQQSIAAVRLKVLVKRGYSNSSCMWAILVDQTIIRLNALNVTEFGKPVEKEPVATSHVQNLSLSFGF